MQKLAPNPSNRVPVNRMDIREPKFGMCFNFIKIFAQLLNEMNLRKSAKISDSVGFDSRFDVSQLVLKNLRRAAT